MTGSDILLYRMLYNLVENAIKYGKQGGAVAVTLEENHGEKRKSGSRMMGPEFP